MGRTAPDGNGADSQVLLLGNERPRKLSTWSCSAWNAGYYAQSTATVPEALRRGLEKNNTDREYFSKLNSRSRYAILYQIQDAKKPETRARRIEKCVAMLSEQK